MGWVDALGVTGALGFLVARYIPVAKLPFWGCALRRTTGWPCPGCGLTRVADRMAHFNVAGAWDANPLGTIGAALFALCMGVSALHLAFKLPVPNVTLERRDRRILQILLWLAVAVNYAFVVIKAKFPQLL